MGLFSDPAGAVRLQARPIMGKARPL